MTNQLTLLIAVPVVAAMVTACGGGGGRSHAPQPAKLAANPAPKAVPVYFPSGVNSGDFYKNASRFDLRNTIAGKLNHSGYGLFTEFDRDGSLVTGANITGRSTPLSQMPRGISATYQGSFVGHENASELLAGNVNLKANFAAGTINGKVSNLQNANSGALKPYGLSMNGLISGNEYKGVGGFTTKSGAPSGKVNDSGLVGDFNGPNAAETAGLLSVSGTPRPGQQHTYVHGAFGAKKK